MNTVKNVTCSRSDRSGFGKLGGAQKGVYQYRWCTLLTGKSSNPPR